MEGGASRSEHGGRPGTVAVHAAHRAQGAPAAQVPIPGDGAQLGRWSPSGLMGPGARMGRKGDWGRYTGTLPATQCVRGDALDLLLHQDKLSRTQKPIRANNIETDGCESRY